MSEQFSVAPRTGKYYGTDILWGKTVIGAVWNHGEWNGPRQHPSKRELAYSHPKMTEEIFWEDCCDSHWESQENYDEAVALVERLNALHQHP